MITNVLTAYDGSFVKKRLSKVGEDKNN